MVILLLYHHPTISEAGSACAYPPLHHFDSCEGKVGFAQSETWQQHAFDLLHGASRWTLHRRVLLAEASEGWVPARSARLACHRRFVRLREHSPSPPIVLAFLVCVCMCPKSVDLSSTTCDPLVSAHSELLRSSHRVQYTWQDPVLRHLEKGVGRDTRTCGGTLLNQGDGCCLGSCKILIEWPTDLDSTKCATSAHELGLDTDACTALKLALCALPLVVALWARM